MLTRCPHCSHTFRARPVTSPAKAAAARANGRAGGRPRAAWRLRLASGHARTWPSGQGDAARAALAEARARIATLHLREAPPILEARHASGLWHPTH